jgi:hypothetical protein
MGQKPMEKHIVTEFMEHFSKVFDERKIFDENS